MVMKVSNEPGSTMEKVDGDTISVVDSYAHFHDSLEEGSTRVSEMVAGNFCSYTTRIN
jgi:hypothetical protein